MGFFWQKKHPEPSKRLSRSPYRHQVFHYYSSRHVSREQGHPSVQWQPSGFTYELRDEHQAEACVVVAVVGVVPVAVRHPAVLRVVVPTPAANNTVRALDACPFFSHHSVGVTQIHADTMAMRHVLFAGMPLHRRVG